MKPMPLGDLLSARATGDLAEVATVAEQDITYHPFLVRSGGNASLGIPANTGYNDVPEKAQVKELTLQEVQLSGGAYKVGDTDFAVRRSTVDGRDQITWGGATWRILEIRPVVVNGQPVLHRLRCRKL